MELQTTLALSLGLSQQLQLSLRILQMNTLDLYEYLSETLLKNPAADISFLDRRPEFVDSTMSPNHSNYQSLSDLLMDQIPSGLPPTEYAALRFLIRSLTPRGFLSAPLKELAQASCFTLPQLIKAQSCLKKMEPPGIGAENTRECLLFQLDQLPDHTELARRIIQFHLTELASGNIRRLAAKLNESYSDVLLAVQQIRHLNPIPANGIQIAEKPTYIVPEIYISQENDQLVLRPTSFNSCKIEISSCFLELLSAVEDAPTKNYLQEQLSELKTIQYCVKQRYRTISLITEEILRRQSAFFLGKCKHLQPLSLVDISSSVNVSPSTVSRAIRGKYLVCPYGVFPYKYFLSRTLPLSYDSVPQSVSMLLALLQNLIDTENPSSPLSDQQLCEMLQRSGIHVARRTVTKYRERLGIPATYLRRHPNTGN